MDTGDPVTALSAKFRVPAQEVEEVYSAQLERLSADARIDDFLSVLAIRNARAILRASTSPKVSDSYDGFDPDEEA